MTASQNVIWLDSSSRRGNIIDAWGEKGDWFTSEMTGISGVEAVFVHATDAQLLYEDDEIADDEFAVPSRDTNRLIERLKQFRDAVRMIKSKPAPLLVVYTGDTDGAEEYLVLFNRTVTKSYPTDSLRYAYIEREANVDQLQMVLAKHLEAKTQSVADEAIKNIQEEVQVKTDVTSAIELAAEVVIWLRETNKRGQVLSHEMIAITDRLRKAFGADGETLKKDLMDEVNAKYPEKSEAASRALDEDNNKGRIVVWKSAGMLLNTDENER